MASPLPPPVVVCSCSWCRKPTAAPGSVSKSTQCSHDDNDICSGCSGSPLVVVKHGAPVPAPPADSVPIEFSTAGTNTGKAAKATSCELQFKFASPTIVQAVTMMSTARHAEFRVVRERSGWGAPASGVGNAEYLGTVRGARRALQDGSTPLSVTQAEYEVSLVAGKGSMRDLLRPVVGLHVRLLSLAVKGSAAVRRVQLTLHPSTPQPTPSTRGGGASAPATGTSNMSALLSALPPGLKDMAAANPAAAMAIMSRLAGSGGGAGAGGGASGMGAMIQALAKSGNTPAAPPKAPKPSAAADGATAADVRIMGSTVQSFVLKRLDAMEAKLTSRLDALSARMDASERVLAGVVRRLDAGEGASAGGVPGTTTSGTGDGADGSGAPVTPNARPMPGVTGDGDGGGEPSPARPSEWVVVADDTS